jgi:hypothetical protein
MEQLIGFRHVWYSLIFTHLVLSTGHYPQQNGFVVFGHPFEMPSKIWIETRSVLARSSGYQGKG